MPGNPAWYPVSRSNLADNWSSSSLRTVSSPPSPQAELTGENDEALGEQGLAGDLGVRIQLQAAVEYAVRDAVGQLVGMAVGDGLGCEQPRLGHVCHPLLLLFRANRKFDLSGGTQVIHEGA
jgi:hypothetical protein